VTPPGATTVEVLAVVFVATLIRSTFGFGEALLALPLLAFVLPVTVAAPLVVLLSITVAAMVVAQDWRKIHVRSTGWLLAPTIAGVPLGVMLLASSHRQAVKVLLALLIVTFAGYLLIGPKPPELRRDSRGWMLAFGFVAGVLGGAYGMNGPPLVVYGAMRRWSPQHFRATLQGYFLPASMLSMAGYWVAGLWVPAVTRYYLLSLPVVVPTVLLGRAINGRMRGDAFLRYVYVGLVVAGTMLLLQAVRGR
jgi:uncharacterized membrane protein YfcA